MCLKVDRTLMQINRTLEMQKCSMACVGIAIETQLGQDQIGKRTRSTYRLARESDSESVTKSNCIFSIRDSCTIPRRPMNGTESSFFTL